MKIEPGTIDFCAIEANLGEACELIDFRTDQVQLVEVGRLWVPPKATQNSARFAGRVNSDINQRRMVFSQLAFIRQDGSGIGPRPVAYKLQHWDKLRLDNFDN